MRNRRHGWLAAAAFGASMVLGLASAHPAAAYAAGNSTWGRVCFHGRCVPKGTLLHVMDGHGVALTYDRAQFTTLWPICNWWVDFDYYDSAGSRYKHIQGQAHGGRCVVNGNVRVDFATGPQLWKTGRACAVLYTNAIRLTQQCHSLHP